MMATVSPEIESNCIPTACSITQGNGACLINKIKKHTHEHAYARTHTHSVYVPIHIPTTDILHMVFTKNSSVSTSVNPFSLYLCVISNPDGQQHFLFQVSSAQPTTPRFITLQSDLRLPAALVSKVIYICCCCAATNVLLIFCA
jgi:hypothetical protein